MVEALISVIGAGLLGVIGWAFHLNSRVAVLEAEHAGLEKLFGQGLQDIKDRLARIEAMLDHHGA